MHNVGLYHFVTYRAGESGYYAPRPRGFLAIDHDSKRYLYDIRGARIGARDARAFIHYAWRSSNGPIRIHGRFPHYHVE